MKLFICSVLISLIICSTVNTKLTLKEVYNQFGDDECIEGDVEVNDGRIVHFIHGQSGQPFKPLENAENQVIGAFFPNEPVKSPVSVITELAKINKLAEPYYHLEDKKGPDHQPTFTVVLLIGGRKFRAEGGSIKQAKNGAAQAALESGIILVNTLQTKKSPGRSQEELTPISQLNNIALKLKMKVEYIREKYQPEAEIYGGSHKGFVNLGKKKSYEERLNASIYKTAKRGPDPDGDDAKGPFTYLVKVGEKLQFRANGRTKRGAKHNAAERAVDAFKEMNLQTAVECLKEGIECNVVNVKSSTSILQEMAQYRHFPITYSLISETGLPHKKTFQIRCEVLDGDDKIFEDGEGLSKKEAKKIAAMKMVSKLSTVVLSNNPISIDGYNKEPKKDKKKKKSINRSDLLLLKEDVVGKIGSVYEYFTTSEDENNAQSKLENYQKRPEGSKYNIKTDEDFESFDDSVDYKRRLRGILHDYKLNENYIAMEEGHRKIALLIISANPKLICIAEAVDMSSAKDLVSYLALKWILNNSDFQFKNMYEENITPGFEDEKSTFLYSAPNEKTR